MCRCRLLNSRPREISLSLLWSSTSFTISCLKMWQCCLCSVLISELTGGLGVNPFYSLRGFYGHDLSAVWVSTTILSFFLSISILSSACAEVDVISLWHSISMIRQHRSGGNYKKILIMNLINLLNKFHALQYFLRCPSKKRILQYKKETLPTLYLLFTNNLATGRNKSEK